ncbi:Ferredoxin-2 [bacterium HR13]|nr:Ferredoxin-2 [bacterium HR13]
MKVFVDKDTCTGCEVCTELAPDIFIIKKGIAVVLNSSPDETYMEVVLKAVEACPSSSIVVGE